MRVVDQYLLRRKSLTVSTAVSINRFSHSVLPASPTRLATYRATEMLWWTRRPSTSRQGIWPIGMAVIEKGGERGGQRPIEVVVNLSIVVMTCVCYFAKRQLNKFGLIIAPREEFKIKTIKLERIVQLIKNKPISIDCISIWCNWFNKPIKWFQVPIANGRDRNSKVFNDWATGRSSKSMRNQNILALIWTGRCVKPNSATFNIHAGNLI